MGSEETSKRKADPDPASVSQLATKRVRFSYDDILTVIVGGGQLTKTFKVHKDLIANRSTYFKSATAPERWLEDKENAVNLPEHYSHTFATYIECLYNPEADLISIAAEAVKTRVASWSRHAGFAEQEDAWTRTTMLQVLAEHWVLADYLGDAAFKNRVIDNLHANINRVLAWVENCQYIVNNTTSSSGLYRWLVEECYDILGSNSFVEIKDAFIERIPPTLYKDILKLFAARSKESEKFRELDCKKFFDKEETE